MEEAPIEATGPTVSKKNIGKMYEELTAIIKSIKNPYLRPNDGDSTHYNIVWKKL